MCQCTKFEVSRFTRYEAMNDNAKCRKLGGLGRLRGTQGHRQCHHSIERIKGKFFLYSLPSVGPGADPGVQAIYLAVVCHFFLPGLRLPS